MGDKTQPIVYTVTSLTCRRYRKDPTQWCYGCETGKQGCWDQVERMALHPNIPIHPTTDAPPIHVPFRVVFREIGKEDWNMSCLTGRDHRGSDFYSGVWVGYGDADAGTVQAALEWLLEGED